MVDRQVRRFEERLLSAGEEKLDSPAVVNDSVTSTACSALDVFPGVRQQAQAREHSVADETSGETKVPQDTRSLLYTVYTQIVMKAGAGSQVNVAEHRKCQRQRGITKLWNGGEGQKTIEERKEKRRIPCDSSSRVPRAVAILIFLRKLAVSQLSYRRLLAASPGV